MEQLYDCCLNCGTQLKGDFCFQCGQKVLKPQDKTLKNFLFQFFGATFFLENNFIKNLWYLLSRPGFLPREYTVGKRKRYMPPLSLFLLVNLFYFMFATLTDLNLSLNEQMNQPHHGWFAKTMVEKRLENRALDVDKYWSSYNDRSTTLAKSMVILHALILAVFIIPLYQRQGFYFIDHLIFSMYFIGFIMLITMLTTGLLYLLLHTGIVTSRDQVDKLWSGPLFLIVIYFFLSVKKFYQENYLSTTGKTVVMLIAFFVTHMLYRTILFLTSFWTT